jgi:hypothetical protein
MMDPKRKYPTVMPMRQSQETEQTRMSKIVEINSSGLVKMVVECSGFLPPFSQAIRFSSRVGPESPKSSENKEFVG